MNLQGQHGNAGGCVRLVVLAFSLYSTIQTASLPGTSEPEAGRMPGQSQKPGTIGGLDVWGFTFASVRPLLIGPTCQASFGTIPTGDEMGERRPRISNMGLSAQNDCRLHSEFVACLKLYKQILNDNRPRLLNEDERWRAIKTASLNGLITDAEAHDLFVFNETFKHIPFNL